MNRDSKVYLFNCHDLPRRAGEIKEYEFDIKVPERVGIDVIAVLADQEIQCNMVLASVKEGVLVSLQIAAVADGECTRCLEPVEWDIDRSIQELYRYAPEKAHTKAQRKGQEAEDDLDSDEDLMMDGEFINLEIPIRDAIILDLPINPLCGSLCLGLCPGCGVKWSNLPPDHAHAVIDARWAPLSELKDLGPGKG